MTKKTKDQVTKKGAVALEESQLEQAQGGVIAISPAQTPVQKVADGSVNKIAPREIFKW